MTLDSQNLPKAATLVLQTEECHLAYVLNSYSDNWHAYYTETQNEITKIQITIEFPENVTKKDIENFQLAAEKRIKEKGGNILRLTYFLKKITNSI